MITMREGSIFTSGAEALVNPVNTYGVMGAGLALQFKNAFPENFSRYAVECQMRRMIIGRVFATRELGRVVINFPTKQNWSSPSRLSWIVEGLADLRSFVEGNHVKSVAVPALGCGLGGLKWGEVLPEITRALGSMSADVFIYPPE